MSKEFSKLTGRAVELKRRGAEIRKMPMLQRMDAAQSLVEDVSQFVVDMANTIHSLEVAVVRSERKIAAHVERIEKLEDLAIRVERQGI